MPGYFYIGLVDFMLKFIRSLLENTYLFSPNDFNRNKKVTLRYFK